MKIMGKDENIIPPDPQAGRAPQLAPSRLPLRLLRDIHSGLPHIQERLHPRGENEENPPPLKKKEKRKLAICPFSRPCSW